MRRQQLKTRISALLMAVSLAVAGSFTSVTTIQAAEETTVCIKRRTRRRKKMKCRLSLVYSWKLRQQ